MEGTAAPYIEYEDPTSPSGNHGSTDVSDAEDAPAATPRTPLHEPDDRADAVLRGFVDASPSDREDTGPSF